MLAKDTISAETAFMLMERDVFFLFLLTPNFRQILCAAVAC